MNYTGREDSSESIHEFGVLEIKGVIRYDFEDPVHAAANLMKAEQHYKWLTPSECSSHVNSVTIELCEMSRIQAIKVVNAHSKFIEVKVGAKTSEGYTYSTLLSKQTLMPGLKSTQPFASKTFSKELSEKWSARKWDRVRVEVSVLRNLGGTSAEKANITPFGLSFIEFYGPPPRKFRKPKQNTPQMVLLSRASSARRALSGIEQTDSHQFLAQLRRKTSSEVLHGSMHQQSKASRALLREKAKAQEGIVSAGTRTQDSTDSAGANQGTIVPPLMWTEAQLLGKVSGFNLAFSNRVNTMMGTYADSVPEVRRASIRDELLGELSLPPHNVWAAKGFWWHGHTGYKPPLHHRMGAGSTTTSMTPSTSILSLVDKDRRSRGALVRKRRSSDRSLHNRDSCSDSDSGDESILRVGGRGVDKQRNRVMHASSAPCGDSADDTMGRVRCMYGAMCYQKNPEHRRKYWHANPPVERSDSTTTVTSLPKAHVQVSPNGPTASMPAFNATQSQDTPSSGASWGSSCSQGSEQDLPSPKGVSKIAAEPTRAAATYDDNTCSDPDDSDDNPSATTGGMTCTSSDASQDRTTDAHTTQSRYSAATDGSDDAMEAHDSDAESTPTCKACGNAARRLTVRKPGANHGRPFFTCSSACNFFMWADNPPQSGTDSVGGMPASGSIPGPASRVPLAPRRRRVPAPGTHASARGGPETTPKTTTAPRATPRPTPKTMSKTRATLTQSPNTLPTPRASLNPRTTQSPNVPPQTPTTSLREAVSRKESQQEPPQCKCGMPATARVVQKEGPNKGRPFFTCVGCSFFQWGDVAIPTASGVLCKCDKPARVCVVRKDGRNKGRSFHTCATCHFFQWVDSDKKSKSANTPSKSLSTSTKTATVVARNGHSGTDSDTPHATSTTQSRSFPVKGASTPPPARSIPSTSAGQHHTAHAGTQASVFTIVVSDDECSDTIPPKGTSMSMDAASDSAASSTASTPPPRGTAMGVARGVVNPWADSDVGDDVEMVPCPICAQEFETWNIVVHSATCTNYT